MDKFIKNITFFGIPIIAYLLIVIVIDPYNYFDTFKILNSKKKENIALSVEPHLFKIMSYENNPTKNLLLGDSRTNALAELIESSNWSNLAYGGASLKEMVQTFWWAKEVTSLDTVLIGINLNLYNKYNKRFWVEETLERKKTFFSYAFSKYVFKSMYLLLKSRYLKIEIQHQKPKASKDEFWEHQLSQTAKKFYTKMDYPETYFNELHEISDYCSQNNIKLIFWIPPTHVDFQKKKIDYNLEKFDQKFITDLSKLGDLHDFDYDSEITRNEKLFKDPLHFDRELGQYVYRDIFLNEQFFSRNNLGKRKTNTDNKVAINE